MPNEPSFDEIYGVGGTSSKSTKTTDEPSFDEIYKTKEVPKVVEKPKETPGFFDSLINRFFKSQGEGDSGNTLRELEKINSIKKPTTPDIPEEVSEMEAKVVPGIFGPTVMMVPKNPKPTSGGKFFQGFLESTAGGLQGIVDEAWDSYKKGDLPRLGSLAVNIGSGGIFSIDPKVPLEKGGIDSPAGKNISNAIKHLTLNEFDPISAVKEFAQSVPFIGPMIEGMNEAFKQGEPERGLGIGLGIIAGAKVGEKLLVKEKITPKEVLEASRELWKRSDEVAKGEVTLPELAKEVAVKKIDEVKTKIVSEKIKKAKQDEWLVIPDENAPLEIDPIMKVPEVDKSFTDAASKTAKEKLGPVFDEAKVKTEEIKSQARQAINEIDELLEPKELSTEESPFRQPSSNVYEGNKSVAVDFEDALNELPDKPKKDVGATTWSLVNDVNKWLEGNEVDIEHTRNFLSELAARAEEFRYKFVGPDYPQSFNDWKETISEAATFARRVDRLKINQTNLIDKSLPVNIAEGYKDWEMMEKFYKKDFSEITDEEIISFEKQKSSYLAEVERGKNATAKRALAKKAKKFGVEEDVDQLARSITDKIEEISNKKDTTSELDKLIKEQAEDAAQEKVAKRRKTRTSLNFGLPIDEAGKIMKDWYSQLREYASEKLGNRASGQQIKATLRKGSTADEWKNVNLDELLDSNKVYTKEEVLKLINENSVEFKDVLLEDRLNIPSTDRTKFHTYQEPGGSNYKELFVTVPLKQGENYKGLTKESFAKERLWLDQDTLDSLWEDVISGKRKPIEVESQYWQDGHADYADIENPIVRLRMNDRVDAQGNKVLFLEELQGPSKENQELMPEYLRKRIREIGMKRALKYAIDNRYDKVAWTTGEMQANRYSLDNIVNNLAYGKDSEGYYLADIDNNRTFATGLLEKELENYVGKDVANKIIRGEGVRGRNLNPDLGEKILSGVNLKNENKGLRKLYDQDLPNVVKKLGGKVEETNLYNGRIDLKGRQVPNNAPMMTVQSTPIDSFKAKASKGFSLYSNVPVEEIAQSVKDLAKLVTKKAEESYTAKRTKPREFLREASREITRALVDKSGNVRSDLLNQLGDQGYRILQKANLSRGASARAKVELEQMRKEVYRGLSNDERKILDELILDIRLIDIDSYKKGFKFPEDIAAYKSHKETFHLKEVNGRVELGVEGKAKIEARAKAYYEWMKKPLKEMWDEGLISEKEYNDLIAHNYRRIGSVNKPLTIEDLLDKKYQTKDQKRTINDSGIDNLSFGRKTDIYEMSSELMALETFSRAYGRIMNNRANKSLLELARSNKDNPFVRIKNKVNKPEGWYEVKYWDSKGTKKSLYIDPSVEQFKKFADSELSKVESKELVDFIKNKDHRHKLTKIPIDVKTKIPKDFIRHFVYENGERKSIWLSPELSQEWVTLSKDISPNVAQIIRYGSLSPLTRTFATGLEWSFALANIPRDIQHIWFASRYFENGKWKSTYSSHLPIFIGQLSHDLASVASDALLRKGRYLDYIREGGGMDFMVHQALPFQKGKTLKGDIIHAKTKAGKLAAEASFALDKTVDFMSYLGETSEIITRLAQRERMIRKGKSSQEATFVARDYMDFSQGGYMTKVMDNAIPFLNASVQGTRGLFRSFKPGSGTAIVNTYKLAQLAAVTVGIYLAMKKSAPNTYDQIKKDPNSQNNLIIPLEGFGFKTEDDKGQVRYPYIKIPLDPGQRFFKKLTEALTDKWLGEEVDAKGTVDALKQLSPVDLSSLPPSFQAAVGYFANYDFWRQKEVTNTPFSYPDSKHEKSKNTKGFYDDLGNFTGLSPERTKFVVDELTARSMWVDLLGGAYNKTLGELPQDKKNQQFTFAVSKVPMIKRFLGLTNPDVQFRTKGDEIKEQALLKKTIEDNELDNWTEGYLAGPSSNITERDVRNFIFKQSDKKVRDRMTKEFDFAKKSKGLNNLNFWMRLKGLDSLEEKAEFYLYGKEKILKQGGPQELFKQESQVSRIGGVLTKEFREAVRKLEFERLIKK